MVVFNKIMLIICFKSFSFHNIFKADFYYLASIFKYTVLIGCKFTNISCYSLTIKVEVCTYCIYFKYISIQKEFLYTTTYILFI